jgi:glycosyltransferase involved in cell wall biosynthesis
MERKLKFYPQGLVWLPWNRYWMITEVKHLGRYFEVVGNPQDADFIYALDPQAPDMELVKKVDKPIVWRVFAGYSKSPIEDVRGRVVVGLYNTETTKSDFLRTYPHEPPPLELAYHPLNEEVFHSPKCPEPIFRHYIYVGSLTTRKRVDWAVDASIKAKVPLLIYHPSDIEPQVYNEVYQKATQYQGLIMPSYNAQPYFIYFVMSCSLALVCTSSWETFYIPSIEVAYLGRPMIAVQLPVHDELWGDTYIKVKDKEELADELAKDATDLGRLSEYGKKMNERLNKDLWNKGVGNFGELVSKIIMEYLKR